MNAGYASTIAGVGRAVDQRRVGQLQRRRSARANAPASIRASRRAAASSFQRARSMPVGSATKPLCCWRAPTTVTSKPLRQQVRALLLQLPQQRAADVADADHRDRASRLRDLEERLVNRVERAHLLRRVDDARDVALRRALRDRADVDVAAARASRTPSPPRRAAPSSPRRRRRGSPGRLRTSTCIDCCVELELELLRGSPRPRAPRRRCARRSRSCAPTTPARSGRR
mgnify:CR=1 FL=1